MATSSSDPRDVIDRGDAVVGIELGSTRIKSVLVDRSGTVLATGGRSWQNRFVDRVWTYDEDDVVAGLQASFRSMCDDAQQRHGTRPTALAAVGVSAMMHGYVALDARDRLVVPFRTWRNTSAGRAATVLTAELGVNIPLRWSVAHLYQAVLDQEPHLPRLARLTTLAGLVHHRLTGEHVLGVGDASGMFPIAADGTGYDSRLARRFDDLVAGTHPGLRVLDLLPRVASAGEPAGRLTADGARLLDPTGGLEEGAPLCPPEGDAGTGMVATNAIAPRCGNVSVGTSIFAMAVLEAPLARVHTAIDLVTTPDGHPVAMVHCNNGASELDAWAGVFGAFAKAAGHELGPDRVFEVLLREALAARADASGLLAYNNLSGEPVTGLDEGRPLYLRTPNSRLTLGGFVRAQVYAAFAALALGMRVLDDEGVQLDVLVAHGGAFRTAEVAQRLLAAALRTPVAVDHRAGEGGAWGIAVLACYLARDEEADLPSWLGKHVFTDATAHVVAPDPADVEGFADFLRRYEAGLAVERAAIAHT